MPKTSPGSKDATQDEGPDVVLPDPDLGRL